MWGIVLRGLVLGACLVVASPMRARAERVLLLPTGGTPSLAADAERLIEALERQLASRGHDVRSASSAEGVLATSLLDCDTSRCARAGLLALGVDLVIAPALWLSQGGLRELTLSVVGASGTPRDLRESAPAAAGLAPALALAAALEASLVELGTVPAHEASPSDEELDGVLLAPDPPARRRSAWNVGLGLGLVLVGAAPLAIASVTLARNGECVRPDDAGVCRFDDAGRYEVYDFGPESAVLMASGVAAIGTGVALLAFRPMRVRTAVDVSPLGARLRLVHSF